MSISDLFNYSDTYNVAKGRMPVTGTNNVNKRNKKLAFKNNSPFRSCITKINNTLIENAEDPEIVIPMYNLSEYNKTYSMTSGSLWNYYRDEVNDDAYEHNDAGNYNLNKNKTAASKFLDYKTKIIKSTQNNNNRLDAEVGPFKCLSNFWRSLGFPLINCEIELDLTWSKNCLKSEISRPVPAADIPSANPSVSAAEATLTNGATFQTNNAEVYVPVTTLTITIT